MGMFDKRREQLGITTKTETKQSSGGTGGESAFARRRSSLQQDKEARRQESIKQAEVRAQPRQQLPSMEQQLRTATSAFKPVLPTSLPSAGEQLKTARESFSPDPNKPAVTRTPYEQWFENKFSKSPVGKALTGLQGADRALFEAKKGALDTATFGLSNPVEKFALNQLDNDMLNNMYAASKIGTPTKVGELAGYVAPGAAIERGVAALARPVIKNLPGIARAGITGATAGSTEALGQEAGDVAFRGRTFDPLNIALGAALGGGLGSGISAVGEGVQMVRNARRDVLRGAIRAAESSSQPKLASRIPGSTQAAPIVEPSAQPVIQADQVPEAYKESWFNKLFGNSSIGITPGAPGRELIDTQIVSRSRERSPLIERAENLATAGNENFVDRFVPFKQINKETYDAAMDSTRANNLANVTIKDKFVDLEGNVLGKSLKDVYANVPRGMKNIADRYVIMRDAVSRMDRGLTVYGKEAWFPQTGEAADAMVKTLEARNPWLKQFGDDWNQFNRNRQDLWVQSGIASPELIGVLRNSNPNYAPMMRQLSKTNLKNKIAFNSSRSGFGGQRAPVQRAVGSTKKIIEPAQGMIESTGASYNAMMRNRAMVQLHDAVKADPEKYKGVIEIVEDTSDMKKATLKAINDALEENGPDGVAAMLNDEINGLFKKAKQATGDSQATVTVMLNGNPVKLRVHDESLLKGIEGIAPEQMGGIVKVFNGISKLIKQSATGLLAPLQGAKLAIRDIPIAAAQSKDKKRFIADISHAAISQMADWLPSFVPGAQKVGRLAREYYRAGGGYEAYLKGDSKIRAVSSDITKDPILSVRNAIKTTRNYNPFKPLKALGDAMENIPRISAFNAEMRKNGWSRDPESVRAAVDAAREATVNWSRRGAKGAEIEAFLPYSNAAVQGTYRLVKRFKEQPVSATALILGIAGAKIAAYEKFKDDPDYQQRSRFEKGIPISKTADGKFRTMAIEPTEAYIADQILHFYKWATDGEKAPGLKENLQEGVNSFLPKYVSGPLATFTSPGKGVDLTSGLSTTTSGSVFEPIGAAWMGKNFYGGDVVPREYQDLATELTYNETTSAAGKWAAETLGIDAFTFDYLGQKFGGDIAKIGLPMTSEVGKIDPAGNVWDETLTKLKLLEDPVMKNRISDDFFSYALTATQAKAANSKKDIPLPSWYQQAYDEVTSTKKGSISSLVSDLNTEKKEIQRSLSLSAQQRADKLRDIQRDINLLRIQGIKRMEELGVPKTRE